MRRAESESAPLSAVCGLTPGYPSRTRTGDLRFMRAMLLPAELSDNSRLIWSALRDLNSRSLVKSQVHSPYAKSGFELEGAKTTVGRPHFVRALASGSASFGVPNESAIIKRPFDVAHEQNGFVFMK